MLSKLIILFGFAAVFVSGRPQVDSTVSTTFSPTQVPVIVNVTVVTSQPGEVIPIKVVGASKADVDVLGVPVLEDRRPVIVNTDEITESTTESTTTETTTISTTTPEVVTFLIGFTAVGPQDRDMLYPRWENEHTYLPGEQVTFDGVQYKALQGHMGSADNLPPPQAPKIWVAIPV